MFQCLVVPVLLRDVLSYRWVLCTSSGLAEGVGTRHDCRHPGVTSARCVWTELEDARVLRCLGEATETAVSVACRSRIATTWYCGVDTTTLPADEHGLLPLGRGLEPPRAVMHACSGIQYSTVQYRGPVARETVRPLEKSHGGSQLTIVQI